MTAKLTALVLSMAFFMVIPLDTATADCGVEAGTTADGFQGAAEAGCGSTDSSSADEVSTSDGPSGTTVAQKVCEGPHGQETCLIGQAKCANGDPMADIWWYPDDGGEPSYLGINCPGDAVPPKRGPSPDDIARAFRQIPLPESVLVIQPPGGATLVNFDTNFLTVAAPFERTVTLLGHQVHFRIRPRSFAWHYGDGTDQTTSKPGAAYPALDVTHRYLEKGTVTPSVDTVWEADFQVDSGAWAPVDGTVTKAGAAQQLRVRSATPVLVG